MSGRPDRLCSIAIRVIVVNDNDDQSFIAAFDKKTGNELWRTARDEAQQLDDAVRVGERRRGPKSLPPARRRCARTISTASCCGR